MDKRCFYCGCKYHATRSDQLYCSKRCRYKDHHRGDMILTLKGKWFNMIFSGVKLEEYREIKPYWGKRFLNYYGMHYDFSQEKYIWNNKKKDIIFRNGYGKDKPSFVAECTISEGYGNTNWGAEEKQKYYILKIHRIYGENNM